MGGTDSYWLLYGADIYWKYIRNGEAAVGSRLHFKISSQMKILSASKINNLFKRVPPHLLPLGFPGLSQLVCLWVVRVH